MTEREPLCTVPAPYFQDDAVTIYHGDCRDILPYLGPVDLVLTDPPYGINLGTNYASRRRGKWAANQDFAPVHGDTEPFDPTPLLVYPKAILWGANYYADKLPAEGQWLVWDKRCGVVANDGADAELAWTRGTKGTVPRIFRHLWNGLLKDSERGDKRYHPTQKPVVLMRWCLGFFPDAQIILDPFMGSGTTLRAAKELSRKAIGIEIEERYCAVARERLRQAVLL